MREIWFKIFHTGGAKFYSLIISLGMLVVTARWLGPEGRGVIAGITTWVTLFGTLGHLSLGQVAIHKAAHSNQEDWLPPTFGTLLGFTVAISLLGWLAAIGLFIISRGEFFTYSSVDVLFLGFLALPFIVWEQYGSSLLIAIGRISVYNNAQLLGRSIGLGLLLLTLNLNYGLAGALLAILVAEAIVALAGSRDLLRRVSWSVCSDWRTVRELLVGGLKLHPNAIGTFLILSIDIVIVSYYRGSIETGYYQLATQLIGVLTMIPMSAALVFYGQVAQLGADVAWVSQRRIVLVIMLGMLALIPGVALIAPWLVPVVAGTAFARSVSVFQMLLPSVIGITLSTLMAAQWIGRGFFLQASFLIMSLGILKVVLDLLWIPAYGVDGAVWSTWVIYTFSFFSNICVALYCQSQVRFNRNKSQAYSANISAS